MDELRRAALLSRPLLLWVSCGTERRVNWLFGEPDRYTIAIYFVIHIQEDSR